MASTVRQEAARREAARRMGGGPADDRRRPTVEVGYDSLELLMAGARAACGRVLRSVTSIADDACHQPSLLPGWSRGHVLTHLARNADGQARMLEGARVGETRDQYPGGDRAREDDIEKGARRPAAEIVGDLTAAQQRLEQVWRELDEDAWHRATRARAGIRPAWASVWARWRECEIHHVDLNLGFRPEDWPDPFVNTLLPDVTAGLALRLTTGTPVLLVASDGPAGLPGEAVTGQGTPHPEKAEPVTVTGTRANLLAWLLGRTTAAPVHATRGRHPVSLPTLAPWA
jgi:maleylpyruvate isomerase